jgi:hypothetical protein
MTDEKSFAGRDARIAQIREMYEGGRYKVGYLPVDSFFGDSLRRNPQDFLRMAAWFNGEDERVEGRTLVESVREENYDPDAQSEVDLSVPTHFLRNMGFDPENSWRPITVYLEAPKDRPSELKAYFSHRIPRAKSKTGRRRLFNLSC